MSIKQKDFLERLFWTLALAGVSFGVVYLTDVNEAWALGLLAVLQVLKNLIAQQVGDPETAGFTDTQAPFFDDDPADPVDPLDEDFGDDGDDANLSGQLS